MVHTYIPKQMVETRFFFDLRKHRLGVLEKIKRKYTEKEEKNEVPFALLSRITAEQHYPPGWQSEETIRVKILRQPNVIGILFAHDTEMSDLNELIRDNFLHSIQYDNVKAYCCNIHVEKEGLTKNLVREALTYHKGLVN